VGGDQCFACHSQTREAERRLPISPLSEGVSSFTGVGQPTTIFFVFVTFLFYFFYVLKALIIFLYFRKH
jgi:hypothetical protein